MQDPTYHGQLQPSTAPSKLQVDQSMKLYLTISGDDATDIQNWKKRLDEICEEASKAVEAGHGFLILSDFAVTQSQDR